MMESDVEILSESFNSGVLPEEKERVDSRRLAKGAEGGSRLGELLMPASMYRVDAAPDCSEGE